MVGGATPPPDGSAAILSLRRLNRIRQVTAGRAVAEAGVILQHLHEAAGETGQRFPLTLGARGSATIGGLLSTNAGGTQVLRWGNMRRLVLGVAAVLPDGTVHDGLDVLPKDNRGYDLSDYEALFEEKLELFSILREEKPVTWQGTMRASLSQADVFPKTENGIRAWVGVGGSPESVIRTARYGYGLMLAIIGGPAARFRPYVDLYHRAVDELGTPALPIGIHSPGHIAETDEQAWEEAYPGFEAQNNTIGAERGWPPYSRMRFQQEVGPGGSIYAGSPETVARKIADTVQTLGAGRFDLKYANGTLGHAKLMRSVELYGTRVIPLVREMLGK